MGLKDVKLPDGECFDESDWSVYSAQYRKLPVVISALRLEVPVTIQTLEGEMRGDVGDWLIRGVSGEFYPCKDEIFRATYEKAQ